MSRLGKDCSNDVIRKGRLASYVLTKIHAQNRSIIPACANAMTSILLADSDSVSRTNLVNSIQKLRPQWQVAGCAEGAQALLHIGQNSVDCLICDSTLSDTKATDLLTSVQKLAPQTIRFVACADVNHEMVLQSTSVNHRFIDRRVEDVVLVEAIENSLLLSNTLNSEILRNYINGTTKLPALPSIYQKMMNMLATPSGCLTGVSKLIETDVGLSATILNVVNSAYYGLSQNIASIAQCVSLLGVHMVKNITLTTHVFAHFEESGLDVARVKQINEHSMRTGALANHFARASRAHKRVVDQVQIAGMLGSIGELVHMCSEEFRVDVDPPVEVEELGAYLLRSWHMPDPVIEAVARQKKGPTHVSNDNQVLHILHGLRFLESNLIDVLDERQIDACKEYLLQWTNENIVDQWIEAYTDVCLLEPSDSHIRHNAA